MMRRCVICAAEAMPTRYAGTGFVECRSCGYSQLADDEGRNDYWSDEFGSASTETYWMGAKRRYFDSALALLEMMTSGRRLLDIGGGVGFFAERAAGRGWEAYSMDISSTATAFASRRLGANRAFTSVPERMQATFDVVTLWCVVAHTTDPLKVTRAAAATLAPGGTIWVTTPNFSFQKPYATARARFGRQLDFSAHDHIGHFTPHAARLLLLRSGFGDPSFHFRGITETCVVAGSDNRLLVRSKRLWNRLAFAAACLHMPNLTSELQITARLTGGDLKSAAPAQHG